MFSYNQKKKITITQEFRGREQKSSSEQRARKHGRVTTKRLDDKEERA